VRYLAAGDLFGVSARTLVGLSNLRSGLRNIYPVQVDLTVLALLAGAGLTYVLADVLSPAIQEAAALIRRLV
jgi:5-methyltetrahydrofolate corrinoid/iron sulfur protein methyltransferase